jgi:hypothetical protein
MDWAMAKRELRARRSSCSHGRLLRQPTHSRVPTINSTNSRMNNPLYRKRFSQSIDSTLGSRLVPTYGTI